MFEKGIYKADLFSDLWYTGAMGNHRGFMFYITGESRDKMHFEYCYKITYESGEVCERRQIQLCVELSKED